MYKPVSGSKAAKSFGEQKRQGNRHAYYEGSYRRPMYAKQLMVALLKQEECNAMLI